MQLIDEKTIIIVKHSNTVILAKAFLEHVEV